MSVNKYNRFPKNETLFQALYRINKKMKDGRVQNSIVSNDNENNLGGGIITKSLSTSQLSNIKEQSKDLKPDLKNEDHLKKNKNFMKTPILSSICSYHKSINENDTNYSDFSNHSECCDICLKNLQNDNSDDDIQSKDKSKGYYVNPKMKLQNLIFLSGPQKNVDDKNNTQHQKKYECKMSHTKNNSYSECCEHCAICQKTLNNESLMSGNIDSQIETDNESINTNNELNISIHSDSDKKGSINEFCDRDKMYKKGDDESSYEPQISIIDEQTINCGYSLSATNTFDVLSHDNLSTIGSNDKVAEAQSVLLIKIISNLEERLNHLETKKKKKKKHNDEEKIL
jgi:hypothetical protein